MNYLKRDFTFSNDLYEKEYIDCATSLKNNEYSAVISTAYGYCIIHMLDNNSTDKYEKVIEDKIAAKEEDKFISIYNKLKDQYAITINFDYWDTISIGSITTPVN